MKMPLFLIASALAIAGCSQNSAPANNAAAGDANASATPAAADNAAEEADDSNSEEGGSATAGAQQDFNLVNNSGHTVMTLNVSPSDQNEWGPDILGTDTLANGGNGTVSFARGQQQCLWDLRATFDNGETGDWRQVNLCEATTITLTPTD